MNTTKRPTNGADSTNDPDAERRARTMQALDAFIATQRVLLERQKADITRLQTLQASLNERPEQVIENLSAKLADKSFRLSEQPEYRIGKMAQGFEWAAFAGCDPTRLQNLTTRAMAALAARAVPPPHPPHTTPSSTPPQISELQALVRKARIDLVDPVLARCSEFVASLGPDPVPDEEDEECIQTRKENAKRLAEREKIKLLKERKLRAKPRCGLSVRGGVLGTQQLGVTGVRGGPRAQPEARGQGEEGVWVRQDGEDESGDVDVTFDDDDFKADSVLRMEDAEDEVIKAIGPGKTLLHHLPPPLPPSLSPSPSPTLMLEDDRRRQRVRKPTRKVRELEERAEEERPRPRGKVVLRINGSAKVVAKEEEMDVDVDAGTLDRMEEDDGEEDEEQDELDSSSDVDSDSTLAPNVKPYKKIKDAKNTPSAGRGGRIRKPTGPKQLKPKPETYKQAWSMEEQNLLEQLLEAIPDGEKFRWQKISRAMDGRRTPRQVASRVQKYFEKLKKFGVV
ncbi:unnamed protein product [Cyclocybe aegerita]|uniref:Myb-like domain-containing protein n=1 Tax=Cyclocybe aegerita TaxID=1973307 RepID=A0A8S0WR17_CYCAE|nr:unnamed protein product [Cyclocybe aegerita]